MAKDASKEIILDTAIADQIRLEFTLCLNRTLTRIKTADTHRPFHAALLSEEALFWSRFERSFSTSFGQGFIESVSKLVCQAGGADEVEGQRGTFVTLTGTQWETIEQVVRDSRTGKASGPISWATDLNRVRSASAFNSTTDRRRVISDLWWKKDGIEHFMSIKTVKPNLDQTAEAKRDLLKLAGEDESRKVYLGLYYNPYGDARSDYAWSPPLRIFNMTTDDCVLIGREYWDTLGGDGTYESVLEIADEVGERIRPKLVKAFQSTL